MVLLSSLGLLRFVPSIVIIAILRVEQRFMATFSLNILISDPSIHSGVFKINVANLNTRDTSSRSQLFLKTK
jgi:hypothetical protein